MYAPEVNRLFEAVAVFQKDTERLERAVAQEPGDPLVHLEDLKKAIGTLMGAVRELENRLSGAADLLRDTQQIFRRLLSSFFSRSLYLDHALKKPRGYAGDYLMLEMLYQREIAAKGMERLLDQYVLDMPIARAVVQRKESVRQWLLPKLAGVPPPKVVDLACGSCRLERDLLASSPAGDPTLVVVDHDPDALTYSRRLLDGRAKIELVQENALNLARGKGNSHALAGARYVVSLGLFEYLPHQVCVRLIRLLRESVAPGGEILICNFDEDNPDQPFMEWVVDWPLIYRNSHDFFGLFIEGGFEKKDLELLRERDDGLVLHLVARVTPR